MDLSYKVADNRYANIKDFVEDYDDLMVNI